MGHADTDLLIIGGGPSGARSAALLSAQGYSTVLLEAGDIDNDVLCSGLLNPEAQEALGMEVPEHVARDPLRPMLEYRDLDSGERLKYDPRYVNTSRPAFDRWLRELAAEAGADLRYETRAGRISHDGRVVNVECRSAGRRESIAARLVLDCSGWRAVSRRQFGNGSSAPYVHAFQGTVESDLPEGSMWAVFDAKLTDYYAWIVPKGGGKFLLGAGFRPGVDETREQAEDPWEKLGPLIDYIRGIGHSIELLDNKPLGSPITTPEANGQLWWGVPGVLPLGEAAGMVSPSSGDGISFCLQCANAVSDAIALRGLPQWTARTGGGEGWRNFVSDVRRNLRPALTELRFNAFKAWTASQPAIRHAALRLLPIYLRRPVER